MVVSRLKRLTSSPAGLPTRGFSSMVLTMVNTAELAPMPSASTRVAMAVNPRFFQRSLTANRTSLMKVVMAVITAYRPPKVA